MNKLNDTESSFTTTFQSSRLATYQHLFVNNLKKRHLEIHFFVALLSMTTINNYILELICIHDCVIVPGLGGFVANYQPAQLDEESGLFSPPNKAIGFNKNLSHNDGLLYHHIIQKETSNYLLAQKLVEDFVNDINIQINTSKVFQLGEIGELSKDNESNYQFKPNVNAQFLADSFGLSSFHISVPEYIKHIEQAETPIRNLINRALTNRSIAASVALLIGLFLATSNVEDPRKISQGSMNNIVEMISTPSLSESIEIEKNDRVIETNVASINTIIETPNPIKLNYHLVVASFPNKADADRYRLKMMNKGFDQTEIISSNNGKNRVTIAHFVNKNDAIVALEDYRNKSGFEDVWILRN